MYLSGRHNSTHNTEAGTEVESKSLEILVGISHCCVIQAQNLCLHFLCLFFRNSFYCIFLKLLLERQLEQHSPGALFLATSPFCTPPEILLREVGGSLRLPREPAGHCPHASSPSSFPHAPEVTRWLSDREIYLRANQGKQSTSTNPQKLA